MSCIAKTSTRWSPLLEVARVEPLLSCDRGDITRVRDRVTLICRLYTRLGALVASSPATWLGGERIWCGAQHR
jgi:hypothetical protein